MTTKVRASARSTIDWIVGLGSAGLIGLGVGVVVGGGVVFALHLGHWLPGGGTRQVQAFSDAPEPHAGALAERFRPWLLFDSGELWRPLNVAYLFDEGTHQFCTRVAGQDSCAPIRNAHGFDLLARTAGALGPATYIDLGGHTLSDYRGSETCGRLLDCGVAPRSAIYYHVTESNDRFYIDYWWYLRFNHFPRLHSQATCVTQIARQNDICDEHEGDWEGVTVVTRPGDERHIDYVVYAAHKGTFRYTAAQLGMRDGSRPVVYVAQGSHASYPRPCPSGCSQPSGLAAVGLVDLPEGNFDGVIPWVRNDDSCSPNAAGSCLQSLSLQTWTNWPGQWGAGCGPACGGALDANSPHSPGLQARYQTPWCSSQNGVFTCDGRALTCSDWLGPLVTAVVCDPAELSKGLRATSAIQAGGLALIIGGKPKTQATTPGVVQALGDPLRPGTSFTAIADGPATQILVRAQQADVTVEDRFAGLPLTPGQRVLITIGPGSDGPTVLANRSRPIERRILEAAATGTKP